jgi:hypothetical protein
MPSASLPFITTIGRSVGIAGTSMRRSRCSSAHRYPSSRSATLVAYTSSDFFRKAYAICSRTRSRSRA